MDIAFHCSTMLGVYVAALHENSVLLTGIGQNFSKIFVTLQIRHIFPFVPKFFLHFYK